MKRYLMQYRFQWVLFLAAAICFFVNSPLYALDPLYAFEDPSEWRYQEYDLTPKYHTPEEKQVAQEERTPQAKDANPAGEYRYQGHPSDVYHSPDIFSDANDFVQRSNSRDTNPLYFSMVEGVTVDDASIGMNFQRMRLEFENLLAYDVDGKVNIDGFRQELNTNFEKALTDQLGINLTNTSRLGGNQNVLMGLKFSF